MSDIKKLLDMMELIHYIDKFKNKIFIFVVTGKIYIRDIIPDIIILQSFNIKVVIIIATEDYKNEDLKSISEKNLSIIMEISAMLKKNSLDPLPSLGTEVFAKKTKQKDYGKVTGFDVETIEFGLSKNKIPLISPIGMDKRGHYYKLDEKDIALELAVSLNATNIFWISEMDGIDIADRKQQFLTYNQVKSMLYGNKGIDEVTEEILNYSLKAMDRGIKDFSILKGETGSIYREVLTYDISGTLISKIDDEFMRKAEIEDVYAIHLLMKNEIERKNILPVTEEEVEQEIESYMVYEVDASIVALGKLNYYGAAAEIAKVATFPRYQGGKKAREICKALIDRAIEENLEYVFGLTINDAMVKVFESLGFREVERNVLPDKWKEHYDFTRPSRSFKLELR